MKAGPTKLITPRLQVLSEDQKETLFLSGLEVLEHTGVRVDNDEGLELISSAGACWPAPACLCPFVACRGA
jgi:trimethylamine:corrinoid methyltransferase-like protein